MTVAAKVDRFLTRYAIGYDIICHSQTRSLRQAAEAAHVAPRQFARALLVQAGRRRCMVVLPLDHLLDFKALETLLGDKPRLLPVNELGAAFDDCELGCIPPLALAYGFEGIYHDSLFRLERVVFEGGKHNSLLRVDGAGFSRLAQGATRADIARPDDSLIETRTSIGTARPSVSAATMDELTPASSLRSRIEAIYELPPMPGHASELLVLRNKSDADVDELAAVVEQDPSLAAQVMKYACSPRFGYSGKVESVEHAIARVLGFDMVLNLALGLAALKPFRIAPDGPLGLKAFWRHATLSAALAQQIAQGMAPAKRPVPGQLYLCGLLHNFGYLLLGRLFEPEFYLLNRMVAANPDIAVTALEQRVLCRGQAREMMCAGHAEVGAWLMERWHLPESVVAAVRAHHDAAYDGEHAVYVHLVLLCDRLLKEHGLGDGDCAELPDHLLQRWGFEAQHLRQTTAEFMAAQATWSNGLEQWVA